MCNRLEYVIKHEIRCGNKVVLGIRGEMTEVRSGDVGEARGKDDGDRGEAVENDWNTTDLDVIPVKAVAVYFEGLYVWT